MYELSGDNFDLGLPREEFYKSACCAEWCEHEPIPPSNGLVQLDVELGLDLHDCDDLNDAARAPAILTDPLDVTGEASCLQILEPEENEKHVTAGAVADDESPWCLPAAVTHATPAPAARAIVGASVITATLPRAKSSRRMTSVLALNDGGVHECDGATSCKSPAPDACSLASRRAPMRPVKIHSRNEKVSGVSASGRKRVQTQKPVRPRSRAIQAKTKTTSSDKVFKVKPRLRRRNYGNPGEYALGGRCDGAAADSAQPVPIDGKVLAEHFHMPLNRAAQQLGICATALKKVSRRLGVLNWPYQQLKPIQRRLADLRESIQKAKTSAFPDTDDIAKEQKEIDRLEKQQLALLRLPCEAGEAKTPAAKKQRTR